VLRSLARVLCLGHLLALSSCAHRPAPDATPWSKASRSARGRHAWACINQGTTLPERRSTVVGGGGGGADSRVVDTSCHYERFLCQQIHRGAQATDDEKAQCRNFESVHGRVSAR